MDPGVTEDGGPASSSRASAVKASSREVDALRKGSKSTKEAVCIILACAHSQRAWYAVRYLVAIQRESFGRC